IYKTSQNKKILNSKHYSASSRPKYIHSNKKNKFIQNSQKYVLTSTISQKIPNPRKNHRIHHRNHKKTIEYHRIHIEIIQTLKLGRVSIHKVGTRIHTHNLGRVPIHTTWDAYTCTKLGRVYTCTCVCTRVYTRYVP